MTRDALVERIESAWRDFRGRVRHVGRGAMTERTPAGWTYRDLVAHVAAWEEQVPRWLGELRAGTWREEFPDDAAVDAFNAKATADRRFVGAEAILDELDSAHRLVLGAVRAMPDAQLRDSRALRVVELNTYGHYPLHQAELDALVSER